MYMYMYLFCFFFVVYTFCYRKARGTRCIFLFVCTQFFCIFFIRFFYVCC